MTNGAGGGLTQTLTNRIPNWQTLFGSTSYCQCEECRSVYGAAAYFVDLLQFLRSPNSSPNASGFTPFDILVGKSDADPNKNLVGRRPDLPFIKLNCQNTNTLMPYVDLVNEILETYVAKSGVLDSSAAHDTPLDATPGELSVNPEYTNDQAYIKLADKQTVFPMTLPFNRWVETARTYLEFLGSSRYEVMKQFGTQSAQQDKAAILAGEFLKMDEAEYSLITGQTFATGVAAAFISTQRLYGYADDPLTLVHDLANMAEVPVFLAKTQIKYEDLVALLNTQYLNPTRSITLQVTPSNATPIPDPCDITQMAISPMDEPTARKFYFFLRLWKRLAWTIPDLDAALTALAPAGINRGFVLAAAQLKELQASLHLPLSQLLTLWSDINVDGRDSLYVNLFQNKGVINPVDRTFRLKYLAPLSVFPAPPYPLSAQDQIRPDPANQLLGFAGTMSDEQRDDLLGWNWPSNDAKWVAAVQALYQMRWHTGTDLDQSGELISSHVNTILAALRISPPDLDAIRSATGLGDTAKLTLKNLSTLYRYALLARALGISIPDLLSLVSLAGISPFNSAAGDPVTDLAMQFVKLSKAVLNSKFSIAQLNYIYRAIADPANGLGPFQSDLDALLLNVQTGLGKIAASNTFAPDPTGAVLRQKLGIVADKKDVAAAMSLIDGTGGYTAPQQQDIIAKTLSFLDPTQATAQLITSPSADVRDRYNYVLAALLAYLQKSQSESLVKQTLSQALSLDPPTTALFLSGLPPFATGALLKSQLDAAQPAIVDFLGGLLASYFSDQNLTAASGRKFGQIVNLDSTATTPTPPFSIRWTGKILPQSSGDYTFYVNANDGVRLWVNGQLLIDQWTNQAVSEHISKPAVSLDSGQLYDLKLEYYSTVGSPVAQLSWSSASVPKALIPQPALFPVDPSPTLLLLYRIALLVSTFSVKVNEIAYLSAHPNDFIGVDPSDNTNTAPFDLSTLPLDRSNPAQTDKRAVAFFNQWLRLNNIYNLRNSFPSGNRGLFDIFATAAANNSATAVSSDTSKSVLASTSWDNKEFATLIGNQSASGITTGFNLSDADFRNEKGRVGIGLTWLQDCLSLSARLGVSTAQLFNWADASPSQDQANDIKNTVKAKYDDATWLTVGKSLNDKLRDESKAALVSYILTRDNIVELGIGNSDELYEYFLIDVNMSPCMQTSRIVQANAAIQLFVQRCLMNLENNNSDRRLNVSPDAIDAAQWQWRKNYRVWEANREVLLYPENYAEPSLRDNKTPFFKELESELQQKEITSETVEQAYRNYLEKLEEVSRLEIAGLCWDPSEDPSPKTLHVFGRSFSSPHVYFYRQLDNSIRVWSPWEKVDVDIEGDHLIPVIWNRRLFVFWPTFKETADTTNQPTNMNIPVPKAGDPYQSQPPLANKKLDLKLSWSERKNNKWTKKQTTAQSFPTQGSGSPWESYQGTLDRSLFVFEATQISGRLTIKIYEATNRNWPDNVDLAPMLLNLEGTFAFSDCKSNGQADSQSREDGIAFFLPGPPNFMDLDVRTRSLSLASANTLSGSEEPDLSLLGTTPYFTQLVFPQQAFPDDRLKSSGPPFFYEDDRRTYFVTETTRNVYSGLQYSDYIKPPYESTQLLAQKVFPGSVGSVLDPQALAKQPQTRNLQTEMMRTTGGATVSGSLAVSDVSNLADRIGEAYVPSERWKGYANFYYFPETGVEFHSHYHPHVCDFIQALNVDGVPGLLALNSQRLTNDLPKDHFYTTSAAEQQNAITQLGFRSEGVACFVFDSQVAGTTPLYRFRSKQGDGGHFYTASATERQTVNTSGAWIDEGIACYVFDSQTVGTTPLYRLYMPVAPKQHLYTISPSERDAAKSRGYLYERVECYVFASRVDSSVPFFRCVNLQTVFEETYQPQPAVLQPYPTEDIDFSFDGAYSAYNWELFFHIPLLIATKLSQNQKFEDAQKWFHYIFNPTSNSTDTVPGRYWNFLPFFEDEEDGRIQNLLASLDYPGTDPAVLAEKAEMEAEITQWKKNPFNPHLICRLRVISYQKNVVMKYLDNLLAWADYNYSQYTRESVAFATQLYVLFKNILGDQPVQIPPQGLILDNTYNDLLNQKNGIDSLSDAAVQLENEFPFSGLGVAAGNGDSGGSSQTSLLTVPYFCTPPNDLLLGYWTTVEKRLFNIRHCLNIKGVAQPLALFAPRINPALLVRAAALGLDLTSALNDINASTPYYRFTYMIQKALDICAEVRALGNALLSALEKKDAEHITLLRSSQETALLKAVLEVKNRQLDEANATLAGLENSRAVTDFRRTWYQNLISTGLSAFEKGQVLALTLSQVFQQSSQAAELLGSELGLIPNFDIGASGFGGSPLASATFGGAQLATAAGAVGRMFSMMAAAATHQATMASLMGGWDRRGQDWNLQLELASLELTQIDKQILAAQIRADIAQKEIDNQQLQIDNAADVEDFLRTKFTNEDLYDWMVSKISGVFFQCYQIAYDLAKRAEACFRFELGLTDSDYIQFGYWDNLKQGLLSGEQLYLDLKRLETAYLDQNKREFEVAKSVSLVLLDSRALITLRETGQCVVNLPEALFDMDYPGHYMRRIKSLSLTIPCVTGPYTSVNCTLTLLSNKTRVDSDTTKAYADPSHFVADFAATQSVATSSAQNDSGLFEVNFHDERYLPFEGAGVVSTWMISMPKDANAFDFESVSDVIFNLKYTSRDGGSLLRDAARKAAVMPISTVQPAQGTAPEPFPAQTNLIRYFSLKHEFPTDWYKFLHPADLATSQAMSIALSIERFPYIYRGNKIQISQVELFLKFKDINDPSQFKLDPKNPTPLGDYAFGGGGSALSLSLTPPGAGTKVLTLGSAFAFLNGVPHAALPPALPPNPPPLGPLGTWTLTAAQADIQKIGGSLQTVVSSGGNNYSHLNADVVDDIFFVCHYSVMPIG